MGTSTEVESVEDIGRKVARELMRAESDKPHSVKGLMQQWGVKEKDRREFFWGLRQELQDECREYDAGSGVVRILGFGKESTDAFIDRGYDGHIRLYKATMGAIERAEKKAPPELRAELSEEKAQQAKGLQQTEHMRNRSRRFRGWGNNEGGGS